MAGLRRLKNLLQTLGAGVCGCGTGPGVNPMAQSLSPRANHNNALWSDPGLLHPKRNNREVLISCACGVFVLKLLVLFFQCLMLSSTTILLVKCQLFSAKGNISLIMCCFTADCAGSRLYRKANASSLSPVAEWTSRFQSRVFANPWVCLAYGRGFQYQNKSGLLFLNV